MIYPDEDIDKAALRILREKTGVEHIFLRQFGTFGQAGRNDTDEFHALLTKYNPGREFPRPLTRYVSIGYYALMGDNESAKTGFRIASNGSWFNLGEIPDLIIDHSHILTTAMNHIRDRIDALIPESQLMPGTFTMAQLQKLYETLLGRPLLRTNFQRKMLSLGHLERLDKQFSGGAHKAPYLYKFKKCPNLH